MNFTQVTSDLLEKYTYEEIAKEAGVSVSYIYKLRSGEREMPGYDVGKALIDMLNKDSKDGTN